MRSFHSLVVYRKPYLAAGGKTAAAQWRPNQLVLACLRSSPGNNKENGRKKRGIREEEGEGRRKWGRQAQLEPKHLGLLAVLPVLLLSAIWSATLYPPNRRLRMNQRVRLAALVGSFTAMSKSWCVRIANGNSRLVISSSCRYAATCRAVSRPSPHTQTGLIISGT